MTDAEAEKPRLLEAGPGCWVRQEIDNIGWLDLGGTVVVVDALEQPAMEDEILALIAETTGGGRVGTVINTHSHGDHTALNEAFRRRHGATILSARGGTFPAAGMTLAGSARSVHVAHLPGCHTAEDLIVWEPAARVLFVGDIFGWGLIPWDRPLDREKLEAIVAAYTRLIAMDPQVVVPGHGPLCGQGELRRWIDYVRGLEAAIKDLHREGLTRRDLPLHRIAPPEDMRGWWRFLKWKHADSVNKIAQAVVRGRL